MTSFGPKPRISFETDDWLGLGKWHCRGPWWSMDTRGITPAEAYEEWRLFRRYAIGAWAYLIVFAALIVTAVLSPCQ